MILLITLLLSTAQAQDKKDDKDKDIYREHYHYQFERDSTTRPNLVQIQIATNKVAQEEKEIDDLLKKNPSDCDKDELYWRTKNLEWTKKHLKQTDDVIATVRRGLKAQLGLLKQYENGEAEGQPDNVFADYVDPHGNVVKDPKTGQNLRSAYISFADTDEAGKPITKMIALRDLISYIHDFEAAADKWVKHSGDDKNSVDQFLRTYQDKDTAKNPKFYNMTLDDAIKAYSTACAMNGTGCLNSVFQVSYKEEQKRTLQIGSGIHIFQIKTTTVLGYQPEYNNYMGTQLRSNNSDKNRVEVNYIQDFGKAMALAEEDAYWKIIQTQQLTINDEDGEVPIDGYLRNIYFDSKRRKDCMRDKSYTFNSDSPPGPFQSYKEKTICTKHGIQIQSASVTELANYGGSTAKVNSIYDITDYVKSRATSQSSYQDTFYAAVTGQGIGSCDTVEVRVIYRCACMPDDIEFKQHHKIDQAFAFSCP